MPRAKVPIEVRFWQCVRKTDGCWEWDGAKNAAGYGVLHTGEHRQKRAHRLSLKFAGLEIRDGMVVDHLCHNRGCVNPSHLRIVTPKANALENNTGVSAANVQKTHCLRGHELNSENLQDGQTRSKGWRICKKCRVIYTREYRMRKRAHTASLRSGDEL